jgi:mannose-6-phosphate isomerase
MAYPALYPLTFQPVFKDYTWGGRNLADRLGRTLPAGIVAESWEVAAHPNGSSVVANGPLAGTELAALSALWGEALVGRRNRDAVARGRFPLLIKLLDANRWLSVQVHPDDTYALAHEGEWGKTEMWVVLYAQPDAELIYGFAKPTDRAHFAEAIEQGEIEPWLQRLTVKAGDVIFVPTGAIHALGPGIIIAEIQQNSDTTYRVYDWGRPRPIHVAQALDVLDFDLVRPTRFAPVDLPGAQVPTEIIGSCRYFQTERLRMRPGQGWSGAADGSTLEIWGLLNGRATLTWAGEPVELHGVAWVVVPAGLGDFRMTAAEESVLLRVITP